MIHASRTGILANLGRTSLALLAVIVAALSIAAPARAGSYVVAQCAAPIYEDAPEAGYTTNSEHFSPIKDCGENRDGLQISHVLVGSETGTNQGAYGAWVLQAPAGTCISGGTVYSKLSTENGVHGYLAVSPDSGASVVTENESDGQLHLSAIPVGCWRYFVARLECTTPNEGSRCVGATPNAFTRVKQIFLQLTDSTQPSLTVEGTMFSGAVLRGSQTISVAAADQGSGVHSVGITVNGSPATGEDLSDSCNELPGGLTSRLAPCPASFAKTYPLNTEDPPFVNGTNTVEVCVADYATEGSPNTNCQKHEVFVDQLCPASPRVGGTEITAGFGNKQESRILPFGRPALIRGRVLDANHNGVEGAQVCIEGHSLIPGLPLHLIATATTNQAGGWSWKTSKGASRAFVLAYRAGSSQVEAELTLQVRARASLHISKKVVRAKKKVVFNGHVAGPLCAERVVILKGSVPGARRSFLVRRARTDPLCDYRMHYRFSEVGPPTEFDFVAVVPQQAGFDFLKGGSRHRFIRVRPCGELCKARKHHHQHRHKGHHHKKRHHHHKRHHFHRQHHRQTQKG
jgi:hypothetical protein